MQKERILMVEDEPPVARLIERYLQQSGYIVCQTVGTGEAALAAAATEKPDLVLMDIALPGSLDGVETAKRLSSEHNLPVVFLSGMDDSATIQRTQQVNAFGFVMKPCRPEELETTIEIALNKHRTERQLRKIEQSFSAAIRSIHDAILITDELGGVTFINRAAETLTGWRLNEVIGRPLAEVLVTERAAPFDAGADFQRKVITEGTTLHTPPDAQLVSRAGARLAIEGSAAPIRNHQGTGVGAVLVFRNISERRRAEAELTQSREQLRLLASHLQSVREEERTGISREIHDSLGQMLTGLKMDVAWLERRAAQFPASANPAALLDKTKAMSTLLDRMVTTVRKIAADLRPGALDDLGLVPALEWHLREFEQRTGIGTQLTAALDGVSVLPAVGTVAFRICQETFTNIARHAGATRAEVTLGVDAGHLVMTVRDNGRGITAKEKANLQSLGLLGMRERAAAAGGWFHIEGMPGKGTMISVRIPLNSRPASKGQPAQRAG